ncbi:hypothetical protein CALVIDRAFT_488412 [Calocera viscosa TUFC12733]|uniref:Uncharacterized protein n=1 Tax=Calocera viscosa (strain TUFC12733) TaxID=1330018 RepID=A0A167HPX9_CALVF|nr:hypothetical protein CALVIDRAFT_490220 [Calocera viscosa TUFC12733]KZO91859.1 hypothetical protein CALVIDRAFT_488412 [Calocera viscosa TUFC12733]
MNCVLDGGSGIIAISDRCCEAIGAPIDPTHRTHMESANGNIDRATGVIRNLKVVIADLVFYVQAHILSDPPFDMLLGRPFHTLASCITVDSSDQSQLIEIHCPNTQRTMRLYTSQFTRTKRTPVFP